MSTKNSFSRNAIKSAICSTVTALSIPSGINETGRMLRLGNAQNPVNIGLLRRYALGNRFSDPFGGTEVPFELRHSSCLPSLPGFPFALSHSHGLMLLSD